MRGLLPRLSLSSQTLILLCSLLGIVFASPGNAVAHALEKIYMWEVYQQIIEVDGAEKNDKIFAFRNGGIDNRGTGPGKSLTFEEFIYHINGKANDIRTTSVRDPTFQPPPRGGSVFDVANDINNRLMGGQIVPSAVNMKFAPSNKKESDSKYRELVTQIAKWGQEYRRGRTDQLDRMVRMIEASSAATAIREADTRQFIAGDIVNRGFGLSKEDLVIEEVQLKQFGDPTTYKHVSLSKTLQKAGNQEKLANSRKTIPDLIAWADNYGDNGPGGARGADPVYTAASNSHFKTIEAWRDANERVLSSTCE